MRLTTTQRRSLVLALSPEWCLSADPDEGPGLRTLRSLQSRGLLQSDDPDDPEFSEWEITAAGRTVLGVRAPETAVPTAFAAIERALHQLFGGAVPVRRPDDLQRQWFSSDGRPYQFTEAVCVLDMDELFALDDLSSALGELTFEDLEQLAHGAAGVATLWGHPVGSEAGGGAGGRCLSYWSDLD